MSTSYNNKRLNLLRVSDDTTQRNFTEIQRYLQELPAAPAVTFTAGTADPNGSVKGNPGDLYLRKSGGAGTTFYVKESGVGTNTGWVGK